MSPRARKRATQQEATEENEPLATPSKMKVTELREALQLRGLSPKGLKTDLVKRLEKALGGTSPTPLSKQLNDEHEEGTEDETQGEAVSRSQSQVEVASPESQSQEMHLNMLPSAKDDVVLANMALDETEPPTCQRTQAASETHSRRAPPHEPPKVVHIKNFVRPFTIPAVKDLVGQFGLVLDFWMDAFKSHCFVHYASGEAAADCLRHLDGLRWPLDCGRLLSATTSSVEAMQTARDLEERPSAAKETSSLKQPLALDQFFRKTNANPPLYYLPAHSPIG